MGEITGHFKPLDGHMFPMDGFFSAHPGIFVSTHLPQVVLHHSLLEPRSVTMRNMRMFMAHSWAPRMEVLYMCWKKDILGGYSLMPWKAH